MTRNTKSFLSGSLLALAIVLTAESAAQADEAQVAAARRLVESNGDIIPFVMHPTSELLRVDYEGESSSSDGFVLTYTYRYSHLLGDFSSRMDFSFDSTGRFRRVSTRGTSAWTPPFFGTDLAMDFLKDIVADEFELNENDLLKQVMNTADARTGLELFLVYRQSSQSSQAVEGPSDEELIGLIRGSESMNDSERQEWIGLLPRMTVEQREELRTILVNERTQLAAIDAKYAGLIDTLDEGMRLLENEEFAQAIEALTPLVDEFPDEVEVRFLRAEAYFGAKQYPQAIDEYSQIIKRSPDSIHAYRFRAFIASKIHDYRRMYLDYHHIVELHSDDESAVNNLAWLLATCPDAKFRDGEEAIKFARQVCELTEWQNPMYFDTLAAAYAENGQFDLAVEWQGKAVADVDALTQLIGEAETRKAQERLELFKQGKSYQEP